jgi:DNA polymerase-3 subunit gamma/tau
MDSRLRGNDGADVPNCSEWGAILPRLRLTGLAQALAANCTMEKFANDKIDLALSKTHEPMYNKKLAERIEQALTEVFRKPMKLEIKITSNEIHTPAKQQQAEKVTKQSNAVEAIKNDTHVQKLMDMFGATLDVNSIETLT